MRDKLERLLVSKSVNKENAIDEWDIVEGKGQDSFEIGYIQKNPCVAYRKDYCKCYDSKEGKMCRLFFYKYKPKHIYSDHYCKCGEPIKYVYAIKNSITGEVIEGIGMKCIRHFLPKSKINKYLFDIRKNKKNLIIRNCCICFKPHNKKNIIENEFLSCRLCPPICNIIDCSNVVEKKGMICSKVHLF